MTITDVLVIGILTACASSIWRDMLGGYLGFSQTALRIAGTIVFSIPAWVAWHNSDPWFSTCGIMIPIYAKSIISMIALFLDIALGVQFTNFFLCAIRYELGPFILGFLVPGWMNWMLLMTVGPVISSVYWMSYKKGWKTTTPFDTETSKFIDGPEAPGELAAGFFTILAFTLIPLLSLVK
jgi:uncharacterized protein YjeT (DUF2065 family)